MEDLNVHIQSIVNKELRQGEEIIMTGFMYKEVAKWMRIISVLRILKLKHFFAVATNQRLILIKTKINKWGGAPLLLNLGVSSIEYCHVVGFKKGKWMNSSQSYFQMRNGEEIRRDILGINYKIKGHMDFYNDFANWFEKEFNAGTFAKLPRVTAMEDVKPKAGVKPAGLFVSVLVLLLFTVLFAIVAADGFDGAGNAEAMVILVSADDSGDHTPEENQESLEFWKGKITKHRITGILFSGLAAVFLGASFFTGKKWWRKNRALRIQ